MFLTALIVATLSGVYCQNNFDYNRDIFTIEVSHFARHERFKRSIEYHENKSNSNISVKIAHLKDSRPKIMIQEMGKDSGVILCLTRNSESMYYKQDIPSRVYISYDSGATYQNKTENFHLNSGKKYSRLNTFYNHPFNVSYHIFTDIINNVIFTTDNNGLSYRKINLDFTPSELVYDADDPKAFVIFDRKDPIRTLYLTKDGGENFEVVHKYVKSFHWITSSNKLKQFYIETINNKILIAQKPDEAFIILFSDVDEMYIEKDFIFVTKKNYTSQELYISHMNGPFVKANFQTEFDIMEIIISDVSGKRIFVSVLHTDSISHLYVSKINENTDEYIFKLSLEFIYCHFKYRKTNGSYADLYKVEGLDGIYIASKIINEISVNNIQSKELASYITFDYGNTWRLIEAPTVDEKGELTNCSTVNNCSLHLHQKSGFTSSAIMSSKSSPGIIIASGVMGESLNGRHGIFVSKDAGFGWKKVFQGDYIFNHGDHGGILVATKHETNQNSHELFYSVDDGENWNSVIFRIEDFKAYSLISSMGGNDTTFTIIGSNKKYHQWILVKIDLFGVFSRNCTKDDYRFWPSPEENEMQICNLGTASSFQRRIPHEKCRNGKNYEVSTKKTYCECKRKDYECDYGFIESSEPSICIRNKTMLDFNPYAIPDNCKPGELYKRTKGYRKISNSVCMDGDNYLPDLIPCPTKNIGPFVIVAGRAITKIDAPQLSLAKNEVSSKSYNLSITNLNVVVGVDYDIKNDCVYWSETITHIVGRKCFRDENQTQEVFLNMVNETVEGLAFDWISDLLFMVVETKPRVRVDVVRTDGNKTVKTIIGPDVLDRPRGLALHPVLGYLFLTDWSFKNPSIYRANLDGSDIKTLFTKTDVGWPNGISIDYIAERIYWVDAKLHYIGSSDLHGRYLKRIQSEDIALKHPFSIGVYEDFVIWDDWYSLSVHYTDKDNGGTIYKLNNITLDRPMHLKIVAHSLQIGDNACSKIKSNGECDVMCVGMPKNTHACLCPNGWILENGKCSDPEGKIPDADIKCSSDVHKFVCNNSRCILNELRCNGFSDCEDGSDEVDCENCTESGFLCDQNKCISIDKKCDKNVDCSDGSDETNCSKRPCEHFTCKNGECIPYIWVCDNSTDCRDNSDEENCQCSEDEFKCVNGNKCISKSLVCNLSKDCPDGSDEEDSQCRNVPRPCEFICNGNQKCIPHEWLCDGSDDCQDGFESDEHFCPDSKGNCPNGLIVKDKICQCLNGKRPDFNWMCPECNLNEFTCRNGQCIMKDLWCDRKNDCEDKSDEEYCFFCRESQFLCSNHRCIPKSWKCNRENDCGDNSDELHCDNVKL